MGPKPLRVGDRVQGGAAVNAYRRTMTFTERNWENRQRRNAKRRLSLKRRRRLAIKCAKSEAKQYEAFVAGMVKFCQCEEPFQIPCDSVLYGGLCDRMTPDSDYDDTDYYHDDDFIP
jgi:hypothetical protein